MRILIVDSFSFSLYSSFVFNDIVFEEYEFEWFELPDKEVYEDKRPNQSTLTISYQHKRKLMRIRDPTSFQLTPYMKVYEPYNAKASVSLSRYHSKETKPPTHDKVAGGFILSLLSHI